MIWNKKMLLLRMRSMVLWSYQAGHGETLGKDLLVILSKYESKWGVSVKKKA